MRRILFSAALAAALVTVALAGAYKMSTPTPPGIAIPDKSPGMQDSSVAPMPRHLYPRVSLNDKGRRTY